MQYFLQGALQNLIMKDKEFWLGPVIWMCINEKKVNHQCSFFCWRYTSWFALFLLCWNKRGRDGERTDRKRNDLWAQGEGEPQEYFSLSGGKREERGRRKDKMKECGEQRERELTEHLTTSSILVFFWGGCIYVHSLSTLLGTPVQSEAVQDSSRTHSAFTRL